MSDKRSVSTDALETLGTIIPEGSGRDAIHLAVEPAVAAEDLTPGQDVGFVDGGFGPCDKPLGIVDPFIKGTVRKGQRFWFVLYPRKITSLRHVWSHPEFDVVPASTDPVEISRKWIEGFASDIDQTYNRVMDAARTYALYEEYTSDNSESYKPHWDKFPEFWKHYQIVTGEEVPKDRQESFFTCSC